MFPEPRILLVDSVGQVLRTKKSVFRWLAGFKSKAFLLFVTRRCTAVLRSLDTKRHSHRHRVLSLSLAALSIDRRKTTRHLQSVLCRTYNPSVLCRPYNPTYHPPQQPPLVVAIAHLSCPSHAIPIICLAPLSVSFAASFALAVAGAARR